MAVPEKRIKVSPRLGWEIAKEVFLPLTVFLLFFTGYIFYHKNILPFIPLKLQENYERYIITLFIVCIGFIVQKLAGAVLGWYRTNIAAKTATCLDDDFIPIIRRSLKVVIWVIVFLIILPFYGVNISALIATLGVSSLAIALAAQDTIANIIAGFLIMIDRPFRIGDKIRLPSGEIVEVLDIGVRRSKFLLEDKAIVIVPNLDLSKSKIVNYTYGREQTKGS